ncbi:MAG TPA: GAF domain-containing protein [Nocardioides sp.]|nr:GAF domain-containing protein [Nocardioides sp.]
MDLEPIRETREALDEIDPPDDAFRAGLERRARAVLEVCPDCVGVSLAGMEHEVTFTLVATDREVAVLDAVQYLTAGPCVDAADAQRVVAVDREDYLSEARWAAFARLTAAAGIASSLTLPILDEGRVVGTVNLYGATPDAFDGRHEQVATIFSAWAPGAVTNADLGFATRRSAEGAPAELRSRHRLAAAIGIVATNERLSLDEAESAIHRAALRAGIDITELADAIIAVERDRSDQG